MDQPREQQRAVWLYSIARLGQAMHAPEDLRPPVESGGTEEKDNRWETEVSRSLGRLHLRASCLCDPHEFNDGFGG